MALLKFAPVESRFCSCKRRGKETFDTPINPCARSTCSRSVAVGLRYLTDRELRRTVQLQLNKGEYRHKLPRRIFFANQGEFTTGDYEEIMNKASCLSLVSNAILYWNTRKITEIVDQLRAQGDTVEEATLAHILLLPFRHVIPNGTYFIEEREPR